MDLRRRENLLKERERERKGENEFNAKQNLSSRVLRFFRPQLKITFSPIKCGSSFTGSSLASLWTKREFTMHAKYSSVTLLYIPFPFVSLRYFAYIYIYIHTFTLLLLHSFLRYWFTAFLRIYLFFYDLQISHVYTGVHTHIFIL